MASRAACSKWTWLSVSYTHLDVYKRQAQTLARDTGFAYTRVLADYAQAALLAAQGRKEQAAEAARHAVREAKDFGFAPLAARIEREF